MTRQITAKRLAQILLDNAEQVDPGIVQRLQDDPWQTIRSDSTVAVHIVDLDETDSECSIAGLYRGETVPPELLVAQSLSPGRRTFSLLHEWGHHRIDRDEQVAEEVFDHDEEESRALEESICDALAALVLLPEEFVSQTIGGKSVDAYTFAALVAESSASREACAVRLAQALTSPGYVVVARRDTETADIFRIQFAASAAGALPIRRGTPQPGTLIAQAFNATRARGRGNLVFPSGARTGEMYGDAVLRGRYVLAVFLEDRPNWGDFALRPRPIGGGYEEQYCEGCAASFRPTGASCGSCAGYVCPTCGRCDCEIRPAPSERDCSRCFQRLPVRMFADGDVCSSCS